MLNVIKFSGHNKKESMKKAVDFYYTNFDDNNLELFLARCRLQGDKTTICFYPDMKADLEAYRKFKLKEKK